MATMKMRIAPPTRAPETVPALAPPWPRGDVFWLWALKGIALLALLGTQPSPAAAQTADPNTLRARQIFQELVEINTVTAIGDSQQAAQAMAARLTAAGFPQADVQVLSAAPRKGNLVARLRGSGARRPMLLLAHLDVVEAGDWSSDPFRLTEKDGYYYGRGVLDNKSMAAAFVANLIRMRQEGLRPERDIVLVLEADEEILDANEMGIRWLLKNHRDLIDAEFALNEGAGVLLHDGRAQRVGLQTSEKVSITYRLEATGPGGHSSLPSKDNAIFRLAAGLARLAGFDFPVVLNETSRVFFEKIAPLQEQPQVGADMRALAAGQADAQALARLSATPITNAQLRTTCVATQLEGGIAPNALPQRARATVNCRVLPGESVPDVQRTLVRVLADERITVTPTHEPTTSAPSPLTREILAPIEQLAAEFWPGAPVVPTMSTGATDGSFLRNAGIPTYGHSGMALALGDTVRIHGKDERISVKSFDQGVEYLYRLVKLLAAPPR